VTAHRSLTGSGLSSMAHAASGLMVVFIPEPLFPSRRRLPMGHDVIDNLCGHIQALRSTLTHHRRQAARPIAAQWIALKERARVELPAVVVTSRRGAASGAVALAPPWAWPLVNRTARRAEAGGCARHRRLPSSPVGTAQLRRSLTGIAYVPSAPDSSSGVVRTRGPLTTLASHASGAMCRNSVSTFCGMPTRRKAEPPRAAFGRTAGRQSFCTPPPSSAPRLAKPADRTILERSADGQPLTSCRSRAQCR
jgi:hypothetical protein